MQRAEPPARIADLRDLRNFKEAKRIKREPIRFRGDGEASASFVPPSQAAFGSFRHALREATDWGHASERLDALAHALWARHMVQLPLPRKVMQMPDRSLAVFWEGLSCRCMVDGFGSLIGGRTGLFAATITTDFLDALAHLARLQAKP